MKDVPCILEFGQNWILSNPLKKTIHKEPSYPFVSHEDCELVPIKETNQFVCFRTNFVVNLCTENSRR
ncbi:hypothetical protein DLM78_03335 [Leptospira stimsonii]|uniref:Uncharacterized protein n=1 Tax=Leptospira stimsonii TaxID=2202203 RepID=A0A8B3CVJ0_9LEPT|nr:hypothetical protein DLM78_03335 [Leptospira stimsonii]